MVGAILAPRRAEPTSCQHPFPSRGFDPFAKPQGNDRNSRDADGRSRREADIVDRGRVRRSWAETGLGNIGALTADLRPFRTLGFPRPTLESGRSAMLMT